IRSSNYLSYSRFHCSETYSYSRFHCSETRVIFTTGYVAVTTLVIPASIAVKTRHYISYSRFHCIETSSSLFKRLAHRAHRGPGLSAPYVFAIFSKFLQWVVLLVKSLKHLGPCPIAPAASLKDVSNRAGLFQTSICRISL